MKHSTIYNIMSMITFLCAFVAFFKGETEYGQELILLAFVIDLKSDLSKIKENNDLP